MRQTNQWRERRKARVVFAMTGRGCNENRVPFLPAGEPARKKGTTTRKSCIFENDNDLECPAMTIASEASTQSFRTEWLNEVVSSCQTFVCTATQPDEDDNVL